jgi:hypothetical protein
MQHEENYAGYTEPARSTLKLTTPGMLDRVLDHWLQNAEGIPYLLAEQAAKARPYMAYFLENNSDKTAEELEELASHLSPCGTVHQAGLLVRIVRANLWDADPLLVAATIWYNWYGGKVGFQFLPDPAETDPDEYQGEVDDLIELFRQAHNGDPLKILTGEDADFYRSLPDRVTVYRGAAGISPELAGMGVCWTTQREIAEWFAQRSIWDGAEPVPVTARVRKESIVAAKASEYEVVCMPGRPCRLKCGHSSGARKCSGRHPPPDTRTAGCGRDAQARAPPVLPRLEKLAGAVAAGAAVRALPWPTARLAEVALVAYGVVVLQHMPDLAQYFAMR